MNLTFSMFLFALVMSLSPGPINIVTLSTSVRSGWRSCMGYVTGATGGFIALLVLTGFGLQGVLSHQPYFMQVLRWAGLAFMCFIAYRLFTDSGQLELQQESVRPSLLSGAIMQWLNPKAWLGAVAGVSTYIPDGDGWLFGQFVLIYFVVCYLSLSCWAWMGSVLQRYLQHAGQVRKCNRMMALLLLMSAGYIFIT